MRRGLGPPAPMLAKVRPRRPDRPHACRAVLRGMDPSFTGFRSRWQALPRWARFSAVGAIWLLYALGYNMSIGVWVGLIALLGLDAETGIFMLLYLDLAHDERVAAGTLNTREDLNEAILHGAVQRVRPKVMTVACAFFGLVPIMWSTGAGADVMKRIAAPMVGGIFTSFLL